MSEPMISEGTGLTIIMWLLGGMVALLSAAMKVLWSQVGRVQEEAATRMEKIREEWQKEIGGVREAVERNRVTSEARQERILEKLEELAVSQARLVTRDDLNRALDGRSPGKPR